MQVKDLAIGDRVDLAGDAYADPLHDHPMFDDLYMEVVEIMVESPTCIAVGFEGWDLCGFPPSHELAMAAR